jgi:ABC-type glutathione transport system ATPase component
MERSLLKKKRLDMLANGLEQRDPVTIRVKGFSLSVPLHNFEWSFPGLLKRFRSVKQILKDVDAISPAGELTAILGGSGSGKVINSDFF